MRHRKENRIPCSLVSTVLNDRSGAENLILDLYGQTRLPDEFVVVDGGSTDGTLEYLEKESLRSPFPLRILLVPGANVSRGRNVAIENARHDVIVTTDFGCRLDSRWVEELMAPFARDASVEIVTGSWKIRKEDVRTPAQWAEWALCGGRMELIATPTCLASTRSMAFSKQVWQEFGRYPEDLTLAGDDAIFSLWMIASKRRIAAAPQAICYWHRFPYLRSYWKEARRNFRGAGEAVFFLSFGVKSGFLFILEVATLGVAAAALIALIAGAAPALWMIPGLAAPLVWSKRLIRWYHAGKTLAGERKAALWPWVVALDLGNRARGLWGYWEGFLHGFLHCRSCRQRLSAFGINRW